jgi:hypothetical protein
MDRTILDAIIDECYALALATEQSEVDALINAEERAKERKRQAVANRLAWRKQRILSAAIFKNVVDETAHQQARIDKERRRDREEVRRRARGWVRLKIDESLLQSMTSEVSKEELAPLTKYRGNLNIDEAYAKWKLSIAMMLAGCALHTPSIDALVHMPSVRRHCWPAKKPPPSYLGMNGWLLRLVDRRHTTIRVPGLWSYASMNLAHRFRYNRTDEPVGVDNANADDLMIEIWAAIPDHFPGRDDIAQNLAVAVLSGEIDRSNIKTHVKRFVDYGDSFRLRSLHGTIRESDTPLIDMVGANGISF